MRVKTLFPFLLVAFFCLSCVSETSTPTPDLDATMEIRMEQTEAARPTATLPPTPTYTPTIPPTATPSPTVEPSAAPTVTEKPGVYSVSVDEEGWKYFTFHQMKFTVGLPPHWSTLDLTADDYQAMLSKAAEVNPELADIYNSQALRNMVAAGVKFIGVDTSQDSLLSGFATNFNLLISDIATKMDLDSYAALNKAQLVQMLGEGMEIKENRITLDNRETVVFSYTSAMNNYYGEPIEVAFLQYLMLDGRTQIILTFTTNEEAFTSNREIFEKIAQSFQYEK